MDNRIKTAPFARNMVAAAVLALTAGGVSAQALPIDTTPINSNLPPGALPSSWDPTYNVCRGVDPKCYHNWVEDRQMRVLVYSRTGGPRHGNLGTRLGPGKNTQNSSFVACTPNTTSCPALNANNVAQTKLREWLNAEGIMVDITEDVTQISGLNDYRAVIFMSTTRDTMWKHGTAQLTTHSNTGTNAHLDAAKTALRQYMRAGGGFAGLHNVFGTEYNWPYYEGLVGNANYYDHGANQLGTAHLTGSPDPATAGIPASFQTIDEWYNFMPYPTNVKHLIRLDEASLANRRETHPGHGNFHPVSWCQYYDGGRVWVSSLGHDAGHFTGVFGGGAQAGQPFPGAAFFKQHAVQGIKAVMGLYPTFCPK